MTADQVRVPRFGRTLRAVHWVHATAFLILLGSGLCLYLPTLAEAVSRRPLLKAIHLYTAVAWVAALVLIAIFGNRRELRRAAREIDRFDADDRAWLRGRGTPQGWLNAGQKLNAIITAAFAVLFAITGFFLWYGERDTRFRLANALLVHDWLMYVSFFLFARASLPLARVSEDAPRAERDDPRLGRRGLGAQTSSEVGRGPARAAGRLKSVMQGLGCPPGLLVATFPSPGGLP